MLLIFLVSSLFYKTSINLLNLIFMNLTKKKNLTTVAHYLFDLFKLSYFN